MGDRGGRPRLVLGQVVAVRRLHFVQQVFGRKHPADHALHDLVHIAEDLGRQIGDGPEADFVDIGGCLGRDLVIERRIIFWHLDGDLGEQVVGDALDQAAGAIEFGQIPDLSGGDQSLQVRAGIDSAEDIGTGFVLHGDAHFLAVLAEFAGQNIFANDIYIIVRIVKTVDEDFVVIVVVAHAPDEDFGGFLGEGWGEAEKSYCEQCQDDEEVHA